MGAELVTVIVAFGTTLVLMASTALFVARSFVRVRVSQALVVHGAGEPRVSFTGMLVMPMHSHEIVDLSAKDLVIDRRGRDALRCRDNLRVDVIFAVGMAVNPTTEDVVRAARTLGGERTASLEAVRDRFESKLLAALAEVVRAVDYDELVSRRMELADRVLDVVGNDLDGYKVDAAHFREVTQTPIELLDKDDILDAIAIRTLTERAAIENAKTHEILVERRRAEATHTLAATEARLRDDAAGIGYRSEIAAAEARVVALDEELREARATLDALRSK